MRFARSGQPLQSSPPQVLTVNVSLLAEFAFPISTGTGIPSLQNHVATYLNSLPIGGAASITRVAQHGYRVGPDLLNITSVQLNGIPADVIVPPSTVIKAGQVEVSLR